MTGDVDDGSSGEPVTGAPSAWRPSDGEDEYWLPMLGVLALFMGPIVAPVAVVYGSRALRRSREGDGSGHRLALACITAGVLSIVGTVVAVWVVLAR